MAKIFVAAPSVNVRQAVRAMRELRTVGHEITFDWTDHVIKAHVAINLCTPFPYSSDELEEIANCCLNGVRNADFFILLISDSSVPSFGVGVELGAAFIHKIPVLLVETTPRQEISSAWCTHPYRYRIKHHFTHVTGAINYINSISV